ncbi:hypothetical protein [Desulfobacter latus]|uniref:Uncharacterized protein n=1 Tax=Desulfobacter latus TaxID=2292 RepID=A0A850TF16_9BACT|nr:hypothetical protein [Desulfobacter latus]NWH06036.1 hypothetical protein [Desulfobacter latus]
MQLSDILAISGTILASIGGGTAIVFGFSNWLGKVWANRLMEKEKNKHNRELEFLKNTFLKETENYKIRLKKSELLFEKQYEAASELVALHRSFIPQIFPHMDWGDVVDHYAFSSKKIEEKLEKYLSRNGAVLGEEIEEKISECISVAGWTKFEINKNTKLHHKVKKKVKKYINC